MRFDKHIRATPGKKVCLADFDPGYTGSYKDRADAVTKLQSDIDRMTVLQDKLYAHDKYSILIILQAMDAAGKDGIIKHVMSGVNPMGCQVFCFKQPSAEELDHDYMWRNFKALPERGRIGIFNRSYYEEVLVTKVHPEYLIKQKLPGIESIEAVDGGFWEARYRQIRNFEHYLVDNGTIPLKFFLNVSREEQKERFLERIQNPDKRWKLSLSDLEERKHWDAYTQAYEEMIEKTGTEESPWYIIPADKKWFSRVAVGEIIVETMESLNLTYPSVTRQKEADLRKAREYLMNEEK